MGEADKGAVKQKVLFLVEAFDKGGIEKVTLDIVNHLDPEAYDVTVQTFWWGGHCQSQVNDHVKVIPFFFRRYVPGVIRLIAYLPPRMLYRLFVHGDYDVEIGASDGGAAKVISGSTNAKAKKIAWVHMDVMARGSKLKEFRSRETGRKIYDRFDRIVCVSEACKEKFIRKFGDFPNITAAHNPLPDQEIRKKALKSVPFQGDGAQTRFVSVGRLAEEKGFDRLIKAAARLVQAGHTRFCVHIVGDGEKRGALEALIQELHMEGYVTLEGFRANPYPYMKGADFYVCTSLDEAFPLSVGEALILGIPVLGTACSGVDEWLEGGNAPYGIRLDNSEDGIYRGLLRCLTMPEAEYGKLKAAAEEKGKAMSMEQQMKQWRKTMLMEQTDEYI